MTWLYAVDLGNLNVENSMVFLQKTKNMIQQSHCWAYIQCGVCDVCGVYVWCLCVCGVWLKCAELGSEGKCIAPVNTYWAPWNCKDQEDRFLGGGIGMGSTCKSMADLCQCMAKTTTIL